MSDSGNIPQPMTAIVDRDEEGSLRITTDDYAFVSSLVKGTEDGVDARPTRESGNAVVTFDSVGGFSIVFSRAYHGAVCFDALEAAGMSPGLISTQNDEGDVDRRIVYVPE